MTLVHHQNFQVSKMVTSSSNIQYNSPDKFMSRRFCKLPGHFLPEKNPKMTGQILPFLTKTMVDKHILIQDHHTLACFLDLVFTYYYTVNTH